MHGRSNRRTFLKHSGAAATAVLAGTPLAGCGGGGDDEPVGLDTQAQLALTATEAV